MISLRVLGPLDLRRNDQPVHTLLAQPKRMALLAYVCASGGGSDEYVRRDAITSLFWPERTNERARAALRTALHMLRTALGDVIESRGNDELRVVPDRLWCDVSAFARACAVGEWTHALDLYRGEFLAGLHGQDSVELDRWIEEQRTRYRAMATTAALRWCDAEEQRGDFAAALELARRAMSLAGPDEVSLRRVMRLHDALGDRAGALAAFEAFSASLRQELDVEPDRETLALARALREGERARPPQSAASLASGARVGSGSTRRRWAPAVTVVAIALVAVGMWAWRRSDQDLRAAPASGQIAELAAGVRGYLQITGMPSPLSHMAAVYDAIHDKVYMVAGVDGRTKTNEVWELDRPGGAVTAGWTRIEPAGPQPRPRFGPSAVYDSTADRLILFGGALGTTAPCANDVWILTNPSRRRGSPAWRELQVSGELPPARAEHWAVWVPAKRRMIVFGGHDCIARRMNDTWVLEVPSDGDAARPVWRRVADIGVQPPARSHHTAVYDEAGDRVIVMGGYADRVVYEDVWELRPASSDTPAWRQLRVRGRGPTLNAHRAAWDPVRRQMLVVGGTSASGPDPANPVWVMSDERDGTVRWRRLDGLRTTPPLRWSHGMVYSGSRDQLIVFGGMTSGGVLNDAWVLMNTNAR